MSKLELDQLSQYTKIVIDTGDIEAIKQFKPTDATTNPSLIYQAAQKQEYSYLLEGAIADAKKHSSSKEEQLEICLEKIAINFGLEILKLVPGRVSTEIDACYSFDTQKTVAKARRVIEAYQSNGIERERILIKIASTWEGIKAAEVLQKEDINCNLTLLFSKAQAIACAEADIKLVSPFVGRILDWYKMANKVDSYPANEDPGVLSVTEIYNYYKKFDYKTEVMGASFRNKEEILELAGCDLLTIAPALLKELEDSSSDVPQKLSVGNAKEMSIAKENYDEKSFRWAMNENAMATEKLAEGIRKFNIDLLALKKLLQEKI